MNETRAARRKENFSSGASMEKKVVVAVLWGIGTLLFGCGTPSTQIHVATAEDAANIYVSAYPAVPWSDISAKLQPNHNLTIDQAEAMVAQTTQVQQAQVYSSLSAGLGIGLPGTTRSYTTTVAPSGTSTTGTQTRVSGSIPSSSGAPAASIANGTLTPSLSSGPLAVGVDADTVLEGSTAVFQHAAILDNQITTQILPHDYRAYLLTLQINVQPRQRDLAYDAYIDVTLLPKSWNWTPNDCAYKPSGGPIVVYPLIITDALEASSAGTSVQALRQASLALSGMIGEVGANGSVQGGTDKLNTIVGHDINSLVTMGRLNDRTLRIRLGAENSGTTLLAMVPRTFNISMMILARWAREKCTNDEPTRVHQLSVVTHTTLYPTDGGAALPYLHRSQTGPIPPPPAGFSAERWSLAMDVKNTLQTYGYHLGKNGCITNMDQSNVGADTVGKPEISYTDADAEVDRYLDFLRAVDESNHHDIASSWCVAPEQPSSISHEKLQRIFASLTEIQADSAYSTLTVALERGDKPTLPPADELAILTDDQKSATTVVLRNGRGLRTGELAAQLHLKNGKSTIFPSSMTVTDGGAEIEVTFPSLTQLQLTEKDLASQPLTLSDDSENVPVQAYSVHPTKAPTTNAVKNPVTATAGAIVCDATGTGQVSLQVGTYPPDKNGKPPFQTPLQLSIAGADVRAGGAVLSSKGIALQPNSVLTLMLGNLTPTTSVTLTTKDSKGQNVGDPVVLHVEQLAANNK
jgi:hypothetical protein